MQNQPHRKGRPVPRRQQLLEVQLDLVGIGVARETESSREPPDMRINHQSGLAEDMAEQHVGGLAPNSGQGHEILHATRDLTAEALQNRARRGLQGAGLLPEETAAHDKLAHLLLGRRRHRRNIGNLPKQLGRKLVDSLVGALRRKNRRDQALPRRGEVEADAGFGVEPGELAGNPPGALGHGVARFFRGPRRHDPLLRVARDHSSSLARSGHGSQSRYSTANFVSLKPVGDALHSTSRCLALRALISHTARFG